MLAYLCADVRYDTIVKHVSGRYKTIKGYCFKRVAFDAEGNMLPPSPAVQADADADASDDDSDDNDHHDDDDAVGAVGGVGGSIAAGHAGPSVRIGLHSSSKAPQHKKTPEAKSNNAARKTEVQNKPSAQALSNKRSRPAG